MCGFLGLAASATAETSDGWVRRVVSKDAVKLEIFRKGQGPAVLMHPSLGRPAQDFEDLGNRIVLAGYSVVMINPRGIGGSTGPLKGVTLHNPRQISGQSPTNSKSIGPLCSVRTSAIVYREPHRRTNPTG
jgi:hypothetical protein